MTVRRTNRIICQQKWKKRRFWKMKLKVKLEYSDKTSCFELQRFSSSSRKFSMRSTTTFKVSGKVLRHRAIQRTSNHGHTTRRSAAYMFYIYLLIYFTAIITSQNNHVHIILCILPYFKSTSKTYCQELPRFCLLWKHVIIVKATSDKIYSKPAASTTIKFFQSKQKRGYSWQYVFEVLLK